MAKERPEDKILVEDGEMFEGTRDMFRDCFFDFDNAHDDQIIDWCKSMDLSLEINGKKIL
jgi:hypothetical protein